METSGWYGVRCIFATSLDGDEVLYEERVTLWLALTVDDALERAETEAVEYARTLDSEYLGLAQAYAVSDELVEGAEVFSLMRTSSLSRTDYLTTHFDTGTERRARS